jgi:hypothetical protein
MVMWLVGVVHIHQWRATGAPRQQQLLLLLLLLMCNI